MARKKKNLADDIYFMMRGVNEAALTDALNNLSDPELRDRDGRTVLINAAFCQRLDIVRLMLSRGADINASDKNGFTALHAAVQNYDFPLIEFLLSEGADIHCRNAFGNNVLMIPGNDCPEAIWKLLLSHGADPHLKNDYDMCAADLWKMGNGPDFLKEYI